MRTDIQRTNKHSAGFSVIELMVALAITAFLLIGLVQIFSSIRASYALQEGLARLQENARFATSFMSRQLREGGYFPFSEHENLNIDIGFNFPSVLTGDVPPILTVNTAEGLSGNGDTVEVNVFSDTNCNDNVNPATTTGNPAIGHKQIMFSHNAANNSLLYTCRFGAPLLGANPPVIINSQPLLNNVETAQFQYGEDLDGDGSADRYVNAGNWAAVGNIVAIRVGLILTSPVIRSVEADAQVINLLGTNFAASGQRELRRPVVFNINLRNQTL